MENKRNKRSLRVALVLGAALAGTALVGFGGLAAWQAYTQNNGNGVSVGSVSHTNSGCASSNSLASAQATPCPDIISVTAAGPSWAGQSDPVTITSTGSLNSLFQMSMPSAPVDANSGSLCGDLNLKVTDNEISPVVDYNGPLSATMGPTTVLASNGHGTSSANSWLTGDSGTYTFDITPSGSFATDSSISGDSCTFDVLFDQTTA